MIARFAVVASVLLLLGSCGKSPEKARKELAQLNVPFEEAVCREYAAREDKVVVDLFLATNIDPGCIVAGAVDAKNVDLAKEALKQEFAPDNQYASSALQKAVVDGQSEMAKLLINKGVESREAFIYSAQLGQMDVVELFLKKGADPNYGIVAASENGHIEVVELLLNKGANPNFDPKNENANNSYALCAAAASGQKEIVKLLLDKKANPNSESSHSCLFRAISNDNHEIVEMLREAGAIDSHLTGKWRIRYDVKNTMNSSGKVRKSYGYRTKYINLTHSDSSITGNLTEVNGDGCNDAQIKGEVVDNNIDWTLEYTGSCCPGGKSAYKGKVNYESNAFFGTTKIEMAGDVKPIETPPENCSLWFASFEGYPVSQ